MSDFEGVGKFIHLIVKTSKHILSKYSQNSAFIIFQIYRGHIVIT